MGTSLEPLKKIPNFVRAHPKRVMIGIIICVLLAVGIAFGRWSASTLQRAKDYDNLKSEYDELEAMYNESQAALDETGTELENAQQKLNETQEELDYAKGQVEQYKVSTNSLTQQVSGLKAEKEDLNNQIEELLKVQETVPVITRSQLEDQLNSIGELATEKYFYRNANKKEESKTWLWGWTMPFSDTSLLATYDGTIKAGIKNIKDIEINVNERTKTITITLPASEILDHNIPQETINVLEVKNNLFSEVSFNDYNKFIAAEKPVMEQEAIDRGFLTEADSEARKIISAFLNALPGMDAYELKFN